MYSYEDRIKAVKLYIESGFNESTVVQILGYPSYTTLRYWYKEYLTTGGLHRSSAAKPRYTEDQKKQAVEYYAPHKTTLVQTCRALGYPTRYVLRHWILEIRPERFKKGTSTCTKEQHLVKYTQEEKQAAVEAML
jgi:putative transposase